MTGTTEIEKKSLEAHVELCAERYNALEDKMVAMGANISHLCEMLQEVKATINNLNEKSTDRLNDRMTDIRYPVGTRYKCLTMNFLKGVKSKNGHNRNNC